MCVCVCVCVRAVVLTNSANQTRCSERTCCPTLESSLSILWNIGHRAVDNSLCVCVCVCVCVSTLGPEGPGGPGLPLEQSHSSSVGSSTAGSRSSGHCNGNDQHQWVLRLTIFYFYIFQKSANAAQCVWYIDQI